MSDGFSLGSARVQAFISDDPVLSYVSVPDSEYLYCPSDRQIPDAAFYSSLGKMYSDGDCVEQNTPKACRYLEIAYSKGSRDIRAGDYLMMGMYRLLEMPEGIVHGLRKSALLAIEWFFDSLKKDVVNNDTHWTNLIYSHLGRTMLDDEVREYETAYKLLKIASVQECEALFYLAKMYYKGYYVEEDRKKAEYYLERILETPEFEDDVFYDSAREIMECWELGMPDEYVDVIYCRLE